MLKAKFKICKLFTIDKTGYTKIKFQNENKAYLF